MLVCSFFSLLNRFCFFCCVKQDPTYSAGKFGEIKELILGMLDTYSYESVSKLWVVNLKFLALEHLFAIFWAGGFFKFGNFFEREQPCPTFYLANIYKTVFKALDDDNDDDDDNLS